jgi:hypothetical protein
MRALISPEKFAKAILWRGEEFIYKFRAREKKIRYGNENPDKKFYIIGFDCGWNGLAWIILHVIGHIEYAESKKYIPVVDLKNFKNQYLSDADIHKENAWEYWFEQPAKYNLQSVAKSKNIIKSRKVRNIVIPSNKDNIGYLGYDYKDEKRMQKLRNLYRKYIKINGEIKSRILQLQRDIVGDKKVLGVMCRGTDFSALKPLYHPIQPNPQDVIEESEIIMKKYNCSHIFLSTEDKEIYNLFSKKFGNSLLSVSQERFSKSDIAFQKSLSNLSTAEERKKTAFSYLTSMYILSECQCFIGGITGGSIIVKIMNDHFEYEHFCDLGIYNLEKPLTLNAVWKSFCEELFNRRLVPD